LQFVPSKARPIIICHHDTMIRPIQSTIPALIALAVGGASLLATAPVRPRAAVEFLRRRQ
jgi:hypothetical protein